MLKFSYILRRINPLLKEKNCPVAVSILFYSYFLNHGENVFLKKKNRHLTFSDPQPQSILSTIEMLLVLQTS